MRCAVFFLSASLLIAPALAETATGPACLDTAKPYRAKWISGRDVAVTARLGAHRPEVRATTTCIGLDAAARIAFTASTSCLAMGDEVAIKRPGEPVQTCKVSHVAPLGPSPQASR